MQKKNELFFPGRALFGEFWPSRLGWGKRLADFLPGGLLSSVDLARHFFLKRGQAPFFIFLVSQWYDFCG